MGKNVLKYGGKSGLLPKIKPIFNGPIRQPTALELAKLQEEQADTGYAKGVPLPIIPGKTILRNQAPQKIINVQEKIDEIPLPEVDLHTLKKLPGDKRDFHLRELCKADFLKQAYLEEEKRLQRIDELEQKVHETNLKRSKEAHEEEVLEHEKSVEGLPTMQALLDNGLVRRRSLQEAKLLKEKRTYNRNVKELQLKERKAEKLLDLYHAAGKFITTEAQLKEAIHNAFEVNVGTFESQKATIEAKIHNRLLGYLTAEANEALIADTMLGEIRGKPGLKQVKDVLSGKAEKIRRSAKMAKHT